MNLSRVVSLNLSKSPLGTYRKHADTIPRNMAFEKPRVERSPVLGVYILTTTFLIQAMTWKNLRPWQVSAVTRYAGLTYPYAWCNCLEYRNDIWNSEVYD